MYEWFSGSLAFLVVWLLIFVCNPSARKEMLWVSSFTTILGFTEPLFVPEYWNPPSLFNLAQRTGFDLESLIFSFSIGGIISVLYEVIFRKFEHRKLRTIPSWHWLAVSAPIFIFTLLFVTTALNPIYSASIAMFLGSLLVMVCRRDLMVKMVVSGGVFLLFYFGLLLFFNLAFPGYIQAVWNWEAISGITIMGVPVEELAFAFTAGMLWSSVYEHVRNLRIDGKKR
ncbi:hypothetical protein HY496_03650 [Candidatus Woesearchaeota archaeon]|nr:hypothetical protein [Candidatus Woesearchaeota archaeon]